MAQNIFYKGNGEVSLVAVAASLIIALWAAAAAVLFALRTLIPDSSWARTLAEAILIGAVATPLIWTAIVAPLFKGPRATRTQNAGVREAVQLSTIDPLTHLLNQRGITSSLLEAMAQAQRYNTPLAIALIRIPSLAEVAQRHGAKGRERIIESAAAAIAEVVRMPDRVGRNGSDDFLVIMPQTKVPAGKTVAERICNAMRAQPVHINDTAVEVHAKYGVVAFGKDQDLEKLLADAAAALAVDKSARPRKRTSTKATDAKSAD